MHNETNQNSWICKSQRVWVGVSEFTFRIDRCLRATVDRVRCKHGPVRVSGGSGRVIARIFSEFEWLSEECGVEVEVEVERDPAVTVRTGQRSRVARAQANCQSGKRAKFERGRARAAPPRPHCLYLLQNGSSVNLNDRCDACAPRPRQTRAHVNRNRRQLRKKFHRKRIDCQTAKHTALIRIRSTEHMERRRIRPLRETK